jgi:hypothetical protein
MRLYVDRNWNETDAETVTENLNFKSKKINFLRILYIFFFVCSVKIVLIPLSVSANFISSFSLEDKNSVAI